MSKTDMMTAMSTEDMLDIIIAQDELTRLGAEIEKIKSHGDTERLNVIQMKHILGLS